MAKHTWPKWIVAVALCAVLGCRTDAQQDAGTNEHSIELSSRTLRVPRSMWKAMTNEFGWADNFEQVTKAPRHAFPRVVTVFKLPMTEDRRVGKRISSNEYVEMFVAHPGTITMQVRVDKKSYWVMSRETFIAPSVYGVDTTSPDHSLYDEEFDRAQQAFQPEIDTTRYLLQVTF